MEEPVLVGDIMERCVRCIHCQQSIAETEEFLTANRISGAPMVATDGQVMGVVSKTDITRFHRDARRSDPEAQIVYEIGTPIAVTVEETTPVKQAAELMVSRQIHRLVVVRAGFPIGILSSLDIAKLVAES
jgi:predicted transcriptional regulator